MIDVILIFILAYLLYRSAMKRGLSSMPYVVSYIATMVLILSMSLYLFVQLFGLAALQRDPGMKVTDRSVTAVLVLQAFSLACELILFFFLRKQIHRTALLAAHEDDHVSDNHNPPPQKKDLSYFR